MTTPQNFRDDIQGLRALAVLAVIGFHLSLPGFAGGYVGVDIFFVISGFLITGLLLREADNTGRIALIAFWARRARRLLPHAFLVLITTLILAAMLSPHYSLSSIGADIAASAGYLSNWRFSASAVDYFAFERPPSPVLHFWSLSIEEQFYIGLPLLLLLIGAGKTGGRKRAFFLLCTIALISFAMFLWLGRSNVASAYFRTDSRIWQLAIGAILAALAPNITIKQTLRAPLLLIGLTLMIGSVLRLTDGLYYSAFAALPVLGCALVLLSGLGATPHLSNALLGNRAAGWIGARSYALYLWHWPIIIFLPALLPSLSGPAQSLTALALSFILAALGYGLIENPARRSLWLSARPITTLILSFVAIAAIIAAALALPHIAPKPAALSEARAAQLSAAWKDFPESYADKCHLSGNRALPGACLYGDPVGSKRAILLGDSHAAQWLGALDAAGRASGYSIANRTKSSCPAALGVNVWLPGRKSVTPGCRDFINNQVKAITNNPPDVVFMTSTYFYQIAGDERGEVLLDAPEGLDALTLGTAKLAEQIIASGTTLILIRDTPQAFRDYRECLERGGGKSCERPKAQALPARDPIIEAYNRLSAQDKARAQILDLTDQVCPSFHCPLETGQSGETKEPKDSGGIIIYRDYHHITDSYSRSLSEPFGQILKDRSER